MPLLHRLRDRKEWQFFAALPRGGRPLALAWWIVVILRGVLPALFAVAMGVLVAAVQRGGSLTMPLAVTGAIFVVLQILPPLHTSISHTLGDRLAAWLYDRLTMACVRRRRSRTSKIRRSPPI